MKRAVSILVVLGIAAPAALATAAPPRLKLRKRPAFQVKPKASPTTTTSLSTTDSRCSEHEICPLQDVETIFGFNKAFAHVHKYSSVMLALREGGEDKGFCSGTLLGPNTIVTAAHCLEESRGKGVADGDVRVVWNYEKYRNGNWAKPRLVGRILRVTDEFDKNDIDLAVATVRWKCGEVPPAWAPPGPKVSTGQFVLSFQHPGGQETHISSGKVLGTDERRADTSKGARVYAWATFAARNNGSGGGVFGPSGGLVGVLYHTDFANSGFVELASVRARVSRLDLWAGGHQLVQDVIDGTARCIQ